GAVFVGTTIIVTGCSTHNEGLPLSVTRTLKLFVPPPEGVQVNTPVSLVMDAPDGTVPVKLKVNVCAGMSSSEAMAVKVICWPGATSTIVSKMPSRCGGVLTLFTTTVSVLLSLRLGEPSSVTMTWMLFVLGLWSACACQVNTPVAGSMTALVGAPVPRLN